MITKNKLLTSILCLAGWLVLVSPVLAVESVKSFKTEITIESEGSFLVEEFIKYDFSSRDRHGIYRHIPLKHAQSASVWYKERQLDIEVLSVTRNGASVPYSLSESGGYLKIKIGDPDKTITGVHDYRIVYKVEGGLSYYDTENPELYWDVTGTEWEVVLEQVRVVVNDPDSIFLEERACYQGTEGSAKSCTSISATTSQVVFTTANVLPGEGLTIAQSLESGKVARQIIEVVSPLYTWVPLVGVLLIVLVSWLYRFKTKHKLDTPVVAMYEPYPGVLPMFTGVLIDGRLDPKDITAGLLYLAQQGFIKIRKTEQKVMFFFEIDDYELTLTKEVDEAPSHFHESILELLFDYGQVGDQVKLSDLKTDKSKQRTNLVKLNKLRSAVADDVVERGFYEQLFKPFYISVYLFLAAVTYIGGGWLLEQLGVVSPEVVVFLGISLVTIVVVIVVVIYRRRTKKGYEALQHIKGFKDFLSVTDKERFKFHNAPNKSPEQFLEYLPYAVALGVEKEWAEVFKDITIASPDWYEGSSVSTFNATALASDLGAFSSSFSSSSGSSGSSGGGSVGGGSGGGGGGSW